MRSDDLYKLPEGMPVPEDDGGADHLKGAALPSVSLPATDGSTVDLSALPHLVRVGEHLVEPPQSQPAEREAHRWREPHEPARLLRDLYRRRKQRPVGRREHHACREPQQYVHRVR